MPDTLLHDLSTSIHIGAFSFCKASFALSLLAPLRPIRKREKIAAVKRWSIVVWTVLRAAALTLLAYLTGPQILGLLVSQRELSISILALAWLAVFSLPHLQRELVALFRPTEWAKRRRVVALVLIGTAFFTPQLDGSARFCVAAFAFFLMGFYLLVKSSPPSAPIATDPDPSPPRSHIEDDRLGFRLHAAATAELLMKEKPSTYGVFGEWGSGKTSFCNMLLEQFQNDRNKTAVFNPWKAQTAEEAWELFARAINERMEPDVSLLSRGVCNFVSRVTGVPELGDAFLSFIQNGNKYDATAIENLQKQIDEHTGNKHLFILVDDPERGEPNVVRNVFAVVDQLRTLKNCTFIFALDRNRLRHAFSSAGDATSASEAEGFLLKLLPRWRNVPSPDAPKANEYLKSLAQDCPKLLRSLSRDQLPFDSNPRRMIAYIQHARALETLYLDRGSDEIDWSGFFLLHLIDHEFPGFAAHCCSCHPRDAIAAISVDFVSDPEGGRSAGIAKEYLNKSRIEFGTRQGRAVVLVERWLSSLAFFSRFSPDRPRMHASLETVLSMGRTFSLIGDSEFKSLLTFWKKTPQIPIREILNKVAYPKGLLNEPLVPDAFYLNVRNVLEYLNENASEILTEKQHVEQINDSRALFTALRLALESAESRTEIQNLEVMTLRTLLEILMQPLRSSLKELDAEQSAAAHAVVNGAEDDLFLQLRASPARFLGSDDPDRPRSALSKQTVQRARERMNQALGAVILRAVERGADPRDDARSGLSISDDAVRSFDVWAPKGGDNERQLLTLALAAQDDPILSVGFAQLLRLFLMEVDNKTDRPSNDVVMQIERRPDIFLEIVRAASIERLKKPVQESFSKRIDILAENCPTFRTLFSADASS